MDRLSPPQRRALVVLFLLVTSVSAMMAGGHTYAIDNEVQLQTTRSLVQLRADLESVDEGWAARADGPYVVRDDGGRVAIVGIGYSIISAPVYVAARVVSVALPVPERESFIRVGTFFTNSIVLGLLAVMVALLALELGARYRLAFAAGAAYALSTYALPHAKTYFTEPASALVLTTSVWSLLRFRRSGARSHLLWCGLSVGAGVLIRASGLLFVPIITVWLAVAAWRRAKVRGVLHDLGWYALGGLPTLGAFLFFNWWRFGGPLEIGYPRIPQENPLLDGLDGLFFSPGKSIFLYAPLVMFGMVAVVWRMRQQFFAMSLIATLCAANIVFFSRVPYWAGDAAWGPRYQHVIVPLLVAPAALLWGRVRWRAPMVLAAGFGVMVSLLGSMLYFNVLFLQADVAGVGSDAMTYDLSWQPMLGMLEELPAGVRDVLEENRPGEVDRGPFWRDPSTHYAYFSTEPRLDFWWLWVGPTGGSSFTYVYFVPILAAVALAIRLCAPTAASTTTLLGWRTRSRAAFAGSDTRSAPHADPAS